MKTKHDTDRYAIKPPVQHETPNAYKRWKIRERRWILAIWIVILVVIIVATRASAAADWLCDYMASLTVYPEVHLAEWIGYPEGWRDMPSDLDDHQLLLPISQDQEQFYLVKTSASAGQQWIWTYRSMDRWTDQNGQHDGHHDFCPAVLVIDQK